MFIICLVPGAVNDKEGTKSKVLDNHNKSTNNQSNTSTASTTKKSLQFVNNTSTTNNNNNKALSKEGDLDIDSDEETENVRMAIEQSKPIPLGTKQLFYVRRKRKYFKLRDILLEAITPKQNSLHNHQSAAGTTAAVATTSATPTTTTTNISAATTNSNNEVFLQGGSLNQLSF